jgi:hypothetical protein
MCELSFTAPANAAGAANPVTITVVPSGPGAAQPFAGVILDGVAYAPHEPVRGVVRFTSEAPAAPAGPTLVEPAPTWREPYDSLRWVRELLERAGAIANAHCDNLVLHRPGECHYCDKHAAGAQAVRQRVGIPFSGFPGAPDALFRPDDVVRRWSGNVAVRKGERHSHLGATFTVGEREDRLERDAQSRIAGG